MRSASLAAFCFVSMALSSLVAAPLVESLAPERGELEWRRDGRRLGLIRFGTNLFKPYVQELYTLNGENVLRDAPADHLHHHGLMYAIRINGVNFWEEQTTPGVEKTIQLLDHSTGVSHNGLSQARCTLLIFWLNGTNSVSRDTNAPFLIERRTLLLTVDDSNAEVAMEWDALFEASQSFGSLKLEGTDYNGLGLRLPQSFDHMAEFQNSENAPYPGTGKEKTRNVVAAKWSSVSGKIGAREITVALFGSPDNPNGNFFFSLLDPFAYAGVTQALNKKSIEVRPGEKWRLHYLVTVYSERKDASFLHRRFTSWQTAPKK